MKIFSLDVLVGNESFVNEYQHSTNWSDEILDQLKTTHLEIVVPHKYNLLSLKLTNETLAEL